MQNRHLLPILLMLLVLALVGAGCGDDSGSGDKAKKSSAAQADDSGSDDSSSDEDDAAEAEEDAAADAVDAAEAKYDTEVSQIVSSWASIMLRFGRVSDKLASDEISQAAAQKGYAEQRADLERLQKQVTAISLTDVDAATDSHPLLIQSMTDYVAMMKAIENVAASSTEAQVNERIGAANTAAETANATFLKWGEAMADVQGSFPKITKEAVGLESRLEAISS